MPKETVLTSIIAHIIGHKYYANIVNTRGTDKMEVCSFIFRSKEEAEQHRRTLETTRTYMYMETVSFRSRKDY